MTTALNVSAAPIQPFAIGGNALQMGPINMQEIVGSQGPESLIVQFSLCPECVSCPHMARGRWLLCWLA